MLNVAYHYMDLVPKGRDEGDGGRGVASAPRRVLRLMSQATVLSAVGLIRTSRRRGFCPACRLFQTGDAPAGNRRAALIALAFFIVAALAWASTIARMSSMDEMAMGLGPFGPSPRPGRSMMAAMMFPSAIPAASSSSRERAERRRGWQVATALLGVTYLGVWLVFGLVCYALYNALGMPWPQPGTRSADGVWSSPALRAHPHQARERGALPRAVRAARPAALQPDAQRRRRRRRYGLSCLGCSAGLMVAMVLIGMSSLVWMIVLTAVVLIYKLAPALTPRWIAALSIALVALGALYAVAG